MTTTRIPVADFERGLFPMIDFTTGEPADGKVELSASPRSGLAPLLILLGIIPYLIWAMTQPKPVFGSLPLTKGSLSRIQRFDELTKQMNRMALAMLILGIVLVVVGSGRGSNIVGSGVVVVIAAVVVAITMNARPYPIRVDLDPNGRSVVLEAHPEFARQFAIGSSGGVAAGRSTPVSVVDELTRLGELHAAGVIDDREFAAAKHKLLQ